MMKPKLKVYSTFQSLFTDLNPKEHILIQRSHSIIETDILIVNDQNIFDFIEQYPQKIFVLQYSQIPSYEDLSKFSDCNTLIETLHQEASTEQRILLWCRLQQLRELQNSQLGAEQRASAIEMASQALSHTYDENQTFNILVDIVATELRSSRVSLLRVDHQLKELHMRAARGIPADIMQKAKPKIGQGIAGQCAQHGKPIFIADHQRFKSRQPLNPRDLSSSGAVYTLQADEMPMSLTVPILVRGDVVGVVNVTDRQDDQPYTQQEITFLSTLMSHAGYLMESANLIKGLQELQAFSDKVIDTLADPLIVLNRQNEVLRSNLSYQNLFNKLSIMEIEDLSHALLHDTVWHKNGWKYDDYVFDLRLLPFGGEDHRFLLFFQNVTERQQMGRQLVSAEKMASLGVLSAGIAHEINNPLGFVKTNTKEALRYFEDLLEIIDSWHEYADQRRLSKDITPYRVEEEVELHEIQEDIPKLIQENLGGLERMQKIISSLKSFAHPDSEHTTQTKLSTLIEHALVITKGKWKIYLKVDKDFTDDPSVFCIPNQIEQVLMNLLVNSAQAAHSRGRVESLTISTKTSHKYAYIKFQDTCGGIPYEVVERIFDPFFTTKDIGEGTGLGLHIAHNIMEGHGGNIQVDSQIPHGVTFTLKLPLGKRQGPLVIKQLSRFKV